MADGPFIDESTHGSDSGAHAEQSRQGAIDGATPPGYDWPTHGGYLGCLLAVMLACLLTPLGYIFVGFLGALLSPTLGGVGVGLAVAVTVIGYIALFAALTSLGWRMGKRYLREYPQPGANAVTEATYADEESSASDAL
ncbi:MAG TPA: hypothetical protein VF808_15875 [Ktedonobacterales bacterium]